MDEAGPRPNKVVKVPLLSHRWRKTPEPTKIGRHCMGQTLQESIVMSHVLETVSKTKSSQTRPRQPAFEAQRWPATSGPRPVCGRFTGCSIRLVADPGLYFLGDFRTVLGWPP